MALNRNHILRYWGIFATQLEDIQKKTKNAKFWGYFFLFYNLFLSDLMIFSEIEDFLLLGFFTFRQKVDFTLTKQQQLKLCGTGNSIWSYRKLVNHQKLVILVLSIQERHFCGNHNFLEFRIAKLQMVLIHFFFSTLNTYL